MGNTNSNNFHNTMRRLFNRPLERQSMKRILATVALALLIVGVSSALPPETRPQPAQATQSAAFDHSNCQYPDRWSNPADGCDNSDPAVPECIKAFSTKEGEEACIAAFVAQNQPALQQPVREAPQPTTNANQCGGK